MKSFNVIAIIGMCLSAVSLQAATPGTASVPSPSSTAADNTGSNREASNRNITADSQKNDEGDLQLIQKIRRSVQADKALSTYAQNIKIVALNGRVTLNGVVHTAAERTALQEKAASVAGAGHVTNQVKVEP